MEAKVADLIAITGKPREACVMALRATGGDANLACEYLMTMGQMGNEYGDEGEYGEEEGYGDMADAMNEGEDDGSEAIGGGDLFE